MVRNGTPSGPLRSDHHSIRLLASCLADISRGVDFLAWPQKPGQNGALWNLEAKEKGQAEAKCQLRPFCRGFCPLFQPQLTGILKIGSNCRKQGWAILEGLDDRKQCSSSLLTSAYYYGFVPFRK